VPTFAAPVPGLAQAIAGFTTPDDLPSDLASAARQLTEAVHKHPEMAGGDGRFDTELMRALPGKLVSKSGAEGLQVIGVLGERTGIAIKIDDGGRRAARAVACALLMDLGLAKAADLADLYQREVLNREQVPVGVVKVRL
jgi:L-asparaginase II